MAKKKVKQLTLATLNKLDSKLNEKKSVYINIGGDDYEVIIDKHFRKSTIHLLILNYLNILQDLKSKQEVTFETLMDTNKLLNTLIVKYFTNIPLPEITNIEGLIAVSNTLLDLGIMEALFNEHFDKNEIEKLVDEVNKVAKNIGKLQGEIGFSAIINELEKSVNIDNDLEEGIEKLEQIANEVSENA